MEGASHVFPHSSIVGACRLPIRHQGFVLTDRSKVTVGHDQKLHNTCFSESWQMNVPRGRYSEELPDFFLPHRMPPKWMFFIGCIEYPRIQVGNIICAQLTLFFNNRRVFAERLTFGPSGVSLSWRWVAFQCSFAEWIYQMRTPNHKGKQHQTWYIEYVDCRSQYYLPVFHPNLELWLITHSQGILKLSGNNSTSNKQYEAWSHICSCMSFRARHVCPSLWRL